MAVYTTVASLEQAAVNISKDFVNFFLTSESHWLTALLELY